MTENIALELPLQDWHHIMSALNGIPNCEVCDVLRKKIEDRIRDAAIEHDHAAGIAGREHVKG